MIKIENVSKTFARAAHPALDRISAQIPEGKITGLVGPDGSGKTTLIRLIAGLLLPTEGKIAVPEGTISYMPQRFGLYEDLTVLQNLSLYADLRGVVGKERSLAFERLLAFTGLAPFQDRLAGALSGGMKQKLGLAATLVKKPRLLLLDEPSVGVDPLSRRELWNMVGQLAGEGISILWSTSYLDEAERCGQVILLNEGSLLYAGEPKEFTQRVVGRVFKMKDGRGRLKEILRSPSVLDATVEGASIRLVLKEGQEQADLQPIPPRFEDAFVDRLGKPAGDDSALAERMEAVASGNDTPVAASNLTKRFGAFTAVEGISFSVNRGEIFGLLGPNGAGKSTTFKLLTGLLKPTSGTASVNGFDLQKTPSLARSKVGYMAQKFSLYGQLSVLQNLRLFSGIYNLSGSEQQDAIREMIGLFGLSPYLSLSAETLPLGFKQRIALACATMHRPTVLFLDEPTSGVDPLTRREFWRHMNGLVEKGVTILITTHFMDEAEYCDRIALVYKGRIIHLDAPDALKALARSEATPEPTLEDAFIHLIENHNG